MQKIIKVSTVPISLDKLLDGQLLYLSNSFEVIAVSSGPISQLKFVGEREKVHFECIEMQRSINILKDLRSLWLLIKFFYAEKPMIVHSITPKAGLLSMVAAKIAGVPVRIHSFTGLIFPTQKGIMQKVLIATDKLLCKCASHIYPEGQGVKADLIRYNITTKPLKILANGNVNGIDTSYFDPNLYPVEQNLELRSKLNIAPETFVFIFVGRLVGDKGINELVEAFSNLNSELRIQNSTLLLVGPFETDLDPLLPDTLAAIENDPNIISVGFKQDVRPYFAIGDALVFPSYREGFPNVVMQAGAMGLPSIVSDINGCNEIIQDGINGIIIPPKNVSKLYEAMIALMTDTPTFQMLASNSRSMIVSRYEREQVWNALLEEYQRLLARL